MARLSIGRGDELEARLQFKKGPRRSCRHLDCSAELSRAYVASRAIDASC